MELIDKGKVVAEIRRYKNKIDERLKIKNRSLSEDIKDFALQNLCGNLLHFIDTLEAKDIDLEKEIKEQTDIYYNMCEEKLKEMSDDDTDLSFLTLDSYAKHFYELGLKAKKG